MTGTRLSVPLPRTTVPRPLSPRELTTYVVIADLLCAGAGAPAPSQLAGYPDLLHRALAVRRDSFDAVMSLLDEAARRAGGQEAWLRRLHRKRPDDFAVLSTVAAGAYLMAPEVRAAIGYPGQLGDPAGIGEAADDLLDLLGD